MQVTIRVSPPAIVLKTESNLEDFFMRDAMMLREDGDYVPLRYEHKTGLYIADAPRKFPE